MANFELAGHYRGGSLTHPILITAFCLFDQKITGSLVMRLGPRPGEVSSGVWARNLLQCLNPQDHSLRNSAVIMEKASFLAFLVALVTVSQEL